MKKLTSVIAVIVLLISLCVSCTPNNLTEDEQQSILIDPEKDCPPNDKNCNGVPDDEE